VARVDQKHLSLGPQYEIVRVGRTVAVVKKHLFTLFRARFTVDVPGPDDLDARGTSSTTNTCSNAAAARWPA
jgi:uncharacterized protein YxjI